MSTSLDMLSKRIYKWELVSYDTETIQRIYVRYT